MAIFEIGNDLAIKAFVFVIVVTFFIVTIKSIFKSKGKESSSNPLLILAFNITIGLANIKTKISKKDEYCKEYDAIEYNFKKVMFSYSSEDFALWYGFMIISFLLLLGLFFLLCFLLCLWLNIPFKQVLSLLV